MRRSSSDRTSTRNPDGVTVHHALAKAGLGHCAWFSGGTGAPRRLMPGSPSPYARGPGVLSTHARPVRGREAHSVPSNPPVPVAEHPLPKLKLAVS